MTAEIVVDLGRLREGLVTAEARLLEAKRYGQDVIGLELDVVGRRRELNRFERDRDEGTLIFVSGRLTLLGGIRYV